MIRIGIILSIRSQGGPSLAEAQKREAEGKSRRRDPFAMHEPSLEHAQEARARLDEVQSALVSRVVERMRVSH